MSWILVFNSPASISISSSTFLRFKCANERDIRFDWNATENWIRTFIDEISFLIANPLRRKIDLYILREFRLAFFWRATFETKKASK